ncbi:MAG TPA: hypothetical protein VKP88_05845 [Candidatus Paceibacterota bacterium]|nr:hypothetical protein [Candidatus Paceibacterota bacterium]
MEHVPSIERHETPLHRAVTLCREADSINKPNVTKEERTRFYALKREFLSLTQDPAFDMTAFKDAMADVAGIEAEVEVSSFPEEPPEWYVNVLGYRPQTNPDAPKVDQVQSANDNRPPANAAA